MGLKRRSVSRGFRFSGVPVWRGFTVLLILTHGYATLLCVIDGPQFQRCIISRYIKYNGMRYNITYHMKHGVFVIVYFYQN